MQGHDAVSAAYLGCLELCWARGVGIGWVHESGVYPQPQSRLPEGRAGCPLPLPAMFPDSHGRAQSRVKTSDGQALPIARPLFPNSCSLFSPPS